MKVTLTSCLNSQIALPAINLPNWLVSLLRLINHKKNITTCIFILVMMFCIAAKADAKNITRKIGFIYAPGSCELHKRSIVYAPGSCEMHKRSSIYTPGSCELHKRSIIYAPAICELHKRSIIYAPASCALHKRSIIYVPASCTLHKRKIINIQV